MILILTADLDSEEEKDRAALDYLLTTMLKEMNFPGKVSTLKRNSFPTKEFVFSL